MKNFFENIIPSISPFTSCNSQSSIPCFSSLARLSASIKPISPLSNYINQFALKTTSETSCSYNDIFKIAFEDKYIQDENHGLTREVRYAPQGAQRLLIQSMIDRMDQLALSHYEVLHCLLTQLCICEPSITIYVSEDISIGFATTIHTNYNAQTNVHEFDLVLYLNKIDGTMNGADIQSGNVNRFDALNQEYVIRNYYNQLRFDLTAQTPHYPMGYFPNLPNTDFEIGIVVHELGHVLDYYRYKSYWSYSTTIQNQTSFKTSHVHAFMWESWYYMDFLRLQYPNKRFSGKQKFMNIPNSYDCDGFTSMLNSNNYPPDMPIPFEP